MDPTQCARCEDPLQYVGTKKFHDGSRGQGFFLGDLGELFVRREHVDVYMCPRCGRVELFVDGLGEDFRPHCRTLTDRGPRLGRARPAAPEKPRFREWLSLAASADV